MSSTRDTAGRAGREETRWRLRLKPHWELLKITVMIFGLYICIMVTDIYHKLKIEAKEILILNPLSSPTI